MSLVEMEQGVKKRTVAAILPCKVLGKIAWQRWGCLDWLQKKGREEAIGKPSMGEGKDSVRGSSERWVGKQVCGLKRM
ncbi:hypothetical protein CDD81_3148 [Ophiocordyceps australis]|uniref:Uncharacterized protein n=1 Tax=Ophiocordyceps australis TaxID=1399860 RepID=A0A2C5XEB3_9HYPO|nr:hypothetical protein CDD81_3148 [Ophiocordyceps australis]